MNLSTNVNTAPIRSFMDFIPNLNSVSIREPVAQLIYD